MVIGEWHLLRILSKYVDYYNRTRTHLSLTKTHLSLGVYSGRARALSWRCHASVGSITNINGGRREPDRTNKWKAQEVGGQARA